MLTANRLREVLTYDPQTGIFRWKVTAGGRNTNGGVAGSNRRRYRQIRVDGKLYQANRLAWFYITGKWPTSEIGFINSNGSDTRWANLREVTPFQKNTNRHNKLGVRGVYASASGKYIARIKLAGSKKHLGTFDTLEEAGAAYAKAVEEAYG